MSSQFNDGRYNAKDTFQAVGHCLRGTVVALWAAAMPRDASPRIVRISLILGRCHESCFVEFAMRSINKQECVLVCFGVLSCGAHSYRASLSASGLCDSGPAGRRGGEIRARQTPSPAEDPTGAAPGRSGAVCRGESISASEQRAPTQHTVRRYFCEYCECCVSEPLGGGTCYRRTRQFSQLQFHSYFHTL